MGSALRPGSGRGKGSVEVDGGGLDIEVEVPEALVKEPPGGGDGVGPGAGGVEDHEPSVGLLRVAVEVDSPVQYVDRRVGVASMFLVLCESEMRIEGAAVQIVADRLDPGVVAALEKVAAVSLNHASERHSRIVVVVGSGRVGERALEIPQVARDFLASRLVAVSSLGEYLERFL